MMYSRQYGEDYFREFQTAQDSDESDKRDGVYNDLFFDNCDIRLNNGRRSAYGPVSFVINERVLLDPGSTIRITKVNPGNTKREESFGEMPYEERYYKEILKGLEDMETVIHVSTADDTKLQKVFEYIMYDMPTLFWCDRSWSGSKYLSENRTEISPG